MTANVKDRDNCLRASGLWPVEKEFWLVDTRHRGPEEHHHTSVFEVAGYPSEGREDDVNFGFSHFGDDAQPHGGVVHD